MHNSKKKVLIFHIGTEKTGTTYLQSALKQNHSVLKSFEISYPCEEPYIFFQGNNHSPIPASFRKECPEYCHPQKHCNPEQLLKILNKTLKGLQESTVILSSEHFSSRMKEVEIERLVRGIDKQFEPKVLIYLRNQLDFYISSRCEAVKAGRVVRFKELSEELENDYFLRDENIIRKWYHFYYIK